MQPLKCHSKGIKLGLLNGPIVISAYEGGGSEKILFQIANPWGWLANGKFKICSPEEESYLDYVIEGDDYLIRRWLNPRNRRDFGKWINGGKRTSFCHGRVTFFDEGLYERTFEVTLKLGVAEGWFLKDVPFSTTSGQSRVSMNSETKEGLSVLRIPADLPLMLVPGLANNIVAVAIRGDGWEDRRGNAHRYPQGDKHLGIQLVLPNIK